MSPEFWSACAAIASAVCAVMVTLMQRRGYVDSTRPEILLNDWQRWDPIPDRPGHDQITISRFTNVGNGIAERLVVYVENKSPDGNEVISGEVPMVQLLPGNSSVDVDYKLHIIWKNESESSYASAVIVLLCWDVNARRVRYATRYGITVYPPKVNVFGPHITRGVAVGYRETRRESVWWLKFKERYLRKSPAPF